MLGRRAFVAGALSITTVLVLSTAVASAADGSSLKTGKIKAAGVSLKYPSNWTVLTLNAKQLAAVDKALGKKNPKLDEYFKSQQQSSTVQNSKFFAIDLAAGSAGQFADNVNVITADGFPSDLGQFTSVVKDAYKQFGATFLGASKLRIHGKTSYRSNSRLPLTMNNGTVVDVREGQLIVPNGRGGAATVTVAAPDDAAGLALIDEVLASVRPISS